MSPHPTRTFRSLQRNSSVTKIANLTQTITKSPIVWGLLAAAAFYALVHGGPLDTASSIRYFTEHPVEYAETVMFAIGVAALLLKLPDILGQRLGLGKSALAKERPAPTGQSIGPNVRTCWQLRHGAAVRERLLPPAACGRRSNMSGGAAPPTAWTTN